MKSVSIRRSDVRHATFGRSLVWTQCGCNFDPRSKDTEENTMKKRACVNCVKAMGGGRERVEAQRMLARANRYDAEAKAWAEGGK